MFVQSKMHRPVLLCGLYSLDFTKSGVGMWLHTLDLHNIKSDSEQNTTITIPIADRYCNKVPMFASSPAAKFMTCFSTMSDTAIIAVFCFLQNICISLRSVRLILGTLGCF